MRESYSVLGKCFEYLNDDCGYEQWSQYLLLKLSSLGAGLKGADLGCGNGYFTRALKRAGYDVVGVDVSPQMLTRAKQLAADEGLKIEFLLQNICKLNLSAGFDFMVSVNDCFNYIPQDKLAGTFKRIAARLKRGGALLFDISSEYKLKEVIGDNLFCEDRDELTYIWFNSLKEDRVVMELTFFIRERDGAYSRRDERHEQFIHKKEDVLAALKSAGFSAEWLGFPLGDRRERDCFICKKL